jgi:hypothetical protein
VVTGAFVSGFLQGFLLFLSLPVNLGRPFGGLTGVGVSSALLVRLWVLHAVVLVGYAFTWSLDERADGLVTPAAAARARPQPRNAVIDRARPQQRPGDGARGCRRRIRSPAGEPGRRRTR